MICIPYGHVGNHEFLKFPMHINISPKAPTFGAHLYRAQLRFQVVVI